MEQLRCILLAIALLASSSSPAQKYFGISGGLVNNVLVGSEIDFQKQLHNNIMSARTGPTFSLLVKNEFTPYLFLKYEGSYVRRGNTSPTTAAWNLNLEYLSIPLKIGFQPVNFYNLAKDIQFALEAGVSFNYGFGRAIPDLAGAYSAASNAKANQFSASSMFGGNLEYRMQSRRILFLNGTWYHDLTPLLSYESGNATYKAGSQGWLFTIGLLFPFH